MFHRVVGINCGETGFDYEATNRSFAAAYEALANGKPLPTLIHSGQESSDIFLNPPGLVIVDVRWIADFPDYAFFANNNQAPRV